MVNTPASPNAAVPVAARRLVTGYLVLVAATVVALVVLTFAAPRFATTEAWVHAVIVAVFAVLLRLRFRAAEHGRAGAARAVTVIAAVLLVVNVVEAALPGVFPVWMRVSMVLIALLMLALVVVSVRGRKPGAAAVDDR